MSHRRLVNDLSVIYEAGGDLRSLRKGVTRLGRRSDEQERQKDMMDA